MIILRASTELRMTFEKLMQTAKSTVSWNGLFVVVDNYIVLQGERRSFIFHFDSQKAADTLIDLEVDPERALDISDNVYVRNVINMILYVFGKWGRINGLKVEKNYEQLNRLFFDILNEIGIEPEYTPKYFRFYKDGMRITYEDVIQAAMEAKEKEPEPIEEKTQGLWHKLVWKRKKQEVLMVETTLAERRKKRIGNNFYLTGCLCPVCKEQLHMVVYPVGKEFRIETEEGNVLLSRAYACEQCCCYYTPYPERLLVEGDMFCMDFEGDRVAYEDYQKLLGKEGDRVSNYNYNRFEDRRGADDKETKEAAGNIKKIAEQLPQISDEAFTWLQAKIEEGFYPDAAVAGIEKQVQKEKARRKEEARQKREKREAQPEKKQQAVQRERKQKAVTYEKERTLGDRDRVRPQQSPYEKEHWSESVECPPEQRESGQNPNAEYNKDQRYHKDGLREKEAQEERYNRPQQSRYAKDADISSKGQSDEKGQESADNVEKYRIRLEKFARLSERQRRELKKQLEDDTAIDDDRKHQFLQQMQTMEWQENLQKTEKLMEDCEKKPYAAIVKIWEQVEKADLPAETKAGFLKRLEDAKNKIPPEQRKTHTEQKYASLESAMHSSEQQDRERIRRRDLKAIEEICQNPMTMDFEEAQEAYQKIEEGPFLPELKSDALKRLRKRLEKIKTDECELLVQKLQTSLAEVQLSDVEGHYFYPARKVLMKEASREETDVIDFAMASYGAGRGEFEYPIFAVDTSHSESGEKGMFLTPENLYYSNLFSSDHISVFSIESIRGKTGLLNKGLYVHLQNGTKVKLPYAVGTSQLPVFAEVLDAFVKYLQEKPFSRKETYLVKERHETICCFRCGYVYKGGNVCPKCGYQTNE